MLSIVECHWATDIRPIVYTHHGLLYYNGNPITTARDLIRIIDFTGNHGATFSSESFAGFIIAIESERLFSSKLESAVYHWLTCMHDERGWLWITKEESWWILFPFSFLFVISLFLFLFFTRREYSEWSVFPNIHWERDNLLVKKWWIYSMRLLIASSSSNRYFVSSDSCSINYLHMIMNSMRLIQIWIINTSQYIM